MLRYRNAAHYLAGILTAMSAQVSWALVLGGLLIFMAYQLNEDWHLRDRAYHDILEFSIGYYLAVAGMIVWRLLS